MVSGLQISVDFCREVVMPWLRHELGDDFDRVAVAVIGTGSDVLGLDDDLSRDHHWSPRANTMLCRADADRLLPRLVAALENRPPDNFRDYSIRYDRTGMLGLCANVVEDFFARFLGTDQLPRTDADWLALCEVDLSHVTSGAIVHDGPGELTRRREHLAYYPDAIWKKRIADWCMYITGREAPYNYNRAVKRADELTGLIYLGQYFKRVMEMCYMLNRRYGPYTKWLNRTFRRLPKYVDRIAPGLDAVLAETDGRRRVFQMVEVNRIIAEALHDLGLTGAPRPRPFDESLTDLTLYDSAVEIYRTLPPGLLAPSFNQIELWEKFAREVLFDPEDYFVKLQEKTGV